MAELLAQFMGPDTLLGKALGAPSFVFKTADGGFNNPAIRAAAPSATPARAAPLASRTRSTASASAT